MGWTWAAACCRGTSHIKGQTRCQDAARAFSLGPAKSTLVCIVSDGAGSARFGGEGASLTCRTISQLASRHFEGTCDLPTEATLSDWLDQLRDRVAIAASVRAAQPRDFAATLVCAVATPDDLLTIHIGDGGIVVREDGAWTIGSWPEAGEYASTTYFVTDDPQPRMRVQRRGRSVSGIALFSDGLERLVLDFARSAPHAPFFERMIGPVDRCELPGRATELSLSLARYLDGQEICARTDDDKSLVLAGWR